MKKKKLFLFGETWVEAFGKRELREGRRFFARCREKQLVGVLSLHGAPRGGQNRPKMRHLVLYKLAGFRHTDEVPLRGFFRGAMRHTLFQKKRVFEKNPVFLVEKCHFSPQKRHFWSF